VPEQEEDNLNDRVQEGMLQGVILGNLNDSPPEVVVEEQDDDDNILRKAEVDTGDVLEFQDIGEINPNQTSDEQVSIEIVDKEDERERR